MKNAFYIISAFSTLVILLFVTSACCKKKIHETVVVPDLAMNPDSINFQQLEAGTLPLLSSFDSLYEFHHQIKLDSQNLFFHASDPPYLWSEPASAYVCGGKSLRVFDNDIEEVFINNQILCYPILCFKNKPFAISVSNNIIYITNLKSQEVETYELEGDRFYLQHLENDEILAYSKKGDRTIYQYFFKNNSLKKVDTLVTHYPIPKERLVRDIYGFSPDLKYLIHKDGQEIVIENLENESVERMKRKGDSRLSIIFSDDGKRLIISETSFGHEYRYDGIRVLSFPELAPVYESQIDPLRGKSTTKDDLLFFTGEKNTLKLVDLKTGQLLFSDQLNKNQVLNNLGIGKSNQIIYTAIEECYMYCNSIDYKKDKITRTLKTSEHSIIPLLSSKDSKVYYFLYNAQLHYLDLETLKFNTIKEHYFHQHYERYPGIIHFSHPTINSDNTKMAFGRYQIRPRARSTISILNISSGQCENIELDVESTRDFGFHFGANPNELLVFTGAEVKTYNLNSRTWNKTEIDVYPNGRFYEYNPRLEEDILQDNSNKDISIVHSYGLLTYYNKETLKVVDTVQYSKFNFMGFSKNGNYYLLKTGDDFYGSIYEFEKDTHSLVNKIKGKFMEYETKVFSSPELDILFTSLKRNKSKKGRLLFSPSEPKRFQFFDQQYTIGASDDLEYVFLTIRDEIKIYKRR